VGKYAKIEKLMDRRISVRAIVVHEGKLLCARLNHYNAGAKEISDYWCLPGGGLDPGEGLVDGVKREMLEETGIEPKVGNLLYVHQFNHSGREWLEFFFHVTNAEDYLKIDLSKSTHGQHEIAEITFIDPAAHNVLPKLLASERLEERIAAGTTVFFSYL
jgi:ADP-ribose pyrophosphatase YjhB (NUDIX family)